MLFIQTYIQYYPNNFSITSYVLFSLVLLLLNVAPHFCDSPRAVNHGRETFLHKFKATQGE